jgi:magnesium-transporting ATPase (P-type)
MQRAKALPAAAGEANVFRVIFFILTFFSIGVVSDFRKLWQQGFGKLAAVYFVSLFGFVIWVGADFVAVLPRRQTAACELRARKETGHVTVRIRT